MSAGNFFSVDGLTINFGGVRALDGLSLAVEQGAIYSLIGPNGAGKTTAFNLMSGFLEPDAGVVRFGGESLARQKPHTIAARGLVRTFQQARVFPGVTVLESVLLGSYLRTRCGLWGALVHHAEMRRREAEALERAGELLDFVGLHRPDELAGRLSYGERKLLEIAIALAASPRMLLLDEPAAGMNPEERRLLKQILLRIQERGLTILLVEHDMNLVMDISKGVFVLNFGRKIAEGAPKDVVRDPDVIKAYLGEGYVSCASAN